MKTAKGEIALSPLQRRIFIGLLVGLALFGAGWFIANVNFSAWDFRNNLWSPTHLLVTGRSPYRIDQLFDANSVWLPMVVGVGFPLGYLTEQVATNLYRVLSLLVYMGVLILSIRQPKPRPTVLILGLLTATVWPPLVAHAVLGQYSLWVVLWCLLAAESLGRRWDYVWAAALLALALVKPQLVILAGPGVAVALWRVGGWSRLLRFGVALLLACVGFSSPVWLGYPDWFEGFLWALNRNQAWAFPSSLQVLQAWFGDGAGGLLWGILVLMLFGVAMRLWWRLPAPAAMRWSLALTPLITPYVWSWDAVLLLPLLLHTLFWVNGWARGFWMLNYAVSFVGIMLIRTRTDNSDNRYWWVGWAMMAGLLITMWVGRRWHKHDEHWQEQPQNPVILPKRLGEGS